MAKIKKDAPLIDGAGLKFPNLGFTQEQPGEKTTVEDKASTEEKVKPERINQQSDFFETIDKMDEKQIENLQQGLAVKEMFYEVPDDESEGNIYGISYYGTIELAKLQGGLECGNYESDDDESDYVVIVSVKDTIRGISVMGMGVQPKSKTTTKGIIRDRFGKIKALSKGQRNGIRQLLDPQLVQSEFEKWYSAKYGTKANFSDIILAGDYTDIKKATKKSRKKK